VAAEGDLAPLFTDLASTDRARRLAAAFRLGEVLAGRGAEEEAARAVAALEAIAADRGEGSWLRKRAKRALAKIRGERAGEEPPPPAQTRP
jgi:hypothetical protein